MAYERKITLELPVLSYLLGTQIAGIDTVATDKLMAAIDIDLNSQFNAQQRPFKRLWKVKTIDWRTTFDSPHTPTFFITALVTFEPNGRIAKSK
jgi:hypothetical protein